MTFSMEGENMIEKIPFLNICDHAEVKKSIGILLIKVNEAIDELNKMWCSIEANQGNLSVLIEKQHEDSIKAKQLSNAYSDLEKFEQFLGGFNIHFRKILLTEHGNKFIDIDGSNDKISIKFDTFGKFVSIGVI